MMALMSGHTMEKLQGEELERQQRDFKGYDKGLVRLNPGRWLFPVDYTKFADNLYKFKFRTSDVVVMTWPKAGTTWTQEIVWTMRNNPNLDHPLAKMGVNDRSPFMEFDMLLGSKKLTPLEDNASFMDTFRKQCPGKDPKDGLTLQMSEAAPDPRTIKTHLPFSLHTPDLLDTAKVVYVARSPKDVVVSYYHHSRLILCHDFNGSLDQFTQYFFDDDLVFGPYWLHMKEAWEKRDHPNMHFIFYEDVKTNNMVELQKLNKFLNTNLTEEQLSGGRSGTGSSASARSSRPRLTNGLTSTPKTSVPLSDTRAEGKLQLARLGDIRVYVIILTRFCCRYQFQHHPEPGQKNVQDHLNHLQLPCFLQQLLILGFSFVSRDFVSQCESDLNNAHVFNGKYRMALMSGQVVETLQGEELERQQRDFEGYDKGLVRLNPGRWLFPVDYTKFADNLYKFKFRTSDVVVMTWPKAGTTWMQEIIWTMRNNPNLDHPLAKMGVNARAPFLDCDMLMENKKLSSINDSFFLEAFNKQCPGKDPKDGLLLQMSEATPDPRTIKTHLPFSLLTPDLLDTAKVVYVARSPKDVVVSYYHHSRLILCHDFNGSLDQFTQYFVDDDLLYGPYWLHMKEAWEKRDHPNMHFVFYEDVKTNNMVELQKLNKFLNTNLTEEQLSEVAKYTSFSVMKARAEEDDKPELDPFFNQDVVKADGGHFRKGEVGDGKKRLSPEQQAKIDQWTHQHTKDFGASFRYSC
ncbi:uncharacterized protein LOC121878492 [Homarus americanus]|uniref:uncharacterized protein LOC121878492 n=1 Tax=Homarus americanus TaxID=6706 RepID=UPI001C46F5E6|nr:uncharacterized protein LOC121878492 [Homarus americanus]